MGDYSSRYQTAQKRTPPRNPWIEQQLKTGVPRDRIHAALVEEGWTAQEADAAIAVSIPRKKKRIERVTPSGRTLPLALVAALVAGALGGVGYGLVVVATRYDVGIVAWVVGIMAATALVRVAGGAAPVPLRVYAALAAGLGMIAGRYVVFVHDFGDALASIGMSRPSYVSPHSVSLFFDNYSTAVDGWSYVWIALAALSAFRTAGRPRPQSD